jgi:hypothetical protein
MLVRVAAAAVSGARDPLSFLPGVAEQLGWYVYALRDPRGSIFYVGKGKGDRVYQHARFARKFAGESGKQLKLDKIRAIHAAGREVGVEIVRHRIADEAGAYEVEAAVMDALAIVGIELTNLAGGHGSARGWQPLEEIIVRYVAEPATIQPDHHVVLIRISREFRSVSTPDELYESTRNWWKMAPHRHNPEFAFSVYGGIVRSVYRIETWRSDERGRWEFDGVRDSAMEELYVWKDVSRHLPAGAQNPIKYVHC